MSIYEPSVKIALLGDEDGAKLNVNVVGDICGSTGQYFYFYKEVVSDYGDTTFYLFRTDLFTVDTDGLKPTKLVGVYKSGDAPTPEVTEE